MVLRRKHRADALRSIPLGHGDVLRDTTVRLQPLGGWDLANVHVDAVAKVRDGMRPAA
jgi:hypothetical protein